MSLDGITWAFKREIPPGPKFVLVALSNYANEDGYCYPSQARLASLTGMGERTVRRHLRWLEEQSLIQRFKTHGTENFPDTYLIAFNRFPIRQPADMAANTKVRILSKNLR